MSRAPSEATQIRTLRRQLREATGEVSSLRLQVRVAQGQATKAQQETADWKRRFDALLAGLPAAQVQVDPSKNGTVDREVAK